MFRSKNRKSLRQKSNAQLNFRELEPRKMLAGDIPAGANLIVNGDFETFTNDDDFNFDGATATARFYSSDLVPGWTVEDGDGDGTQRINLQTYDNSALGTVVDLDSIAGQDDRLFQDVTVSVGQQYVFSFDFFSPDQVEGVSDSATTDFDVYYNGELLGSLQGTSVFHQASFVVTGAANDPDGSTEDGDSVTARFEFRDGSVGDREGDGRGSLIDDVSLVAVTSGSVVNGGFESVDADEGPDFAPEDVDGFSVFNFADDTEDRVIQIFSDDGEDADVDTSDFLNLNSSPELIDQVFQDLATEAGGTYLVTFDARVDPTSTLPADQLRVRFDNQHAATVIANDQFQTYSVLVEATSETSRLTFREAGGFPGEGASPQIDNVQLFRVDEVSPVNVTPFIEQVGDQTVDFGQALNLSIEATDPDGDAADLTFELLDDGGLGELLSVSEAGELSLPVASQAGNFDIVVGVTDAAGATAEENLLIEVAEFVPFEGVGALSNIPPEQRNGIFSSPPPQNIDTDLTFDAVLDTSQGEIRIRLLDDESPTFVNNFINLAEDGFYDGTVFHRVIEGFVAQGGDPLGQGFGGPGFQIPDEVGNDIEFDSRGQLSFANSGSNTTGSQFFITFGPTGLNNDDFSVFGEVISGDDVLDQLTRTLLPGEIPIPGATPDVVNSIRIEEVSEV